MSDDRLSTLKDSLQLLAGEINRRKFSMESSVQLRQQFYRLSHEYKRLKHGKGGEIIMADEKPKAEKSGDVLTRNLKKTVLALLLELRHTPDKWTVEQKEKLLADLRKLV